ncbi:hypothetical protein [Flavobacterium lacustre]|uniref:hypothetical protein n=1 Tax=Flavobacterium lacustre TaxID=3016339 RepID=UPI0022B6781F|nr:hypothetical protein [Flavobacterium lacustre]
MKKQYNQLLNESNKKRSNIYYQLNQLTEITGLSPRMLKYKMLKVKDKYESVTNLLKKEGRNWQIHHSIINEFMPINKRKNSNEKNYDWKSFVSWNPYKNYDCDYHFELIKEMKSNLPEITIKYTIELDGRGFNHVHFISDASVPDIKMMVDRVISKYFSWYEISYQVSKINNKYSSISYTQKAPVKIGTL